LPREEPVLMCFVSVGNGAKSIPFALASYLACPQSNGSCQHSVNLHHYRVHLISNCLPSAFPKDGETTELSLAPHFPLETSIRCTRFSIRVRIRVNARSSKCSQPYQRRFHFTGSHTTFAALSSPPQLRQHNLLSTPRCPSVANVRRWSTASSPTPANANKPYSYCGVTWPSR